MNDRLHMYEEALGAPFLRMPLFYNAPYALRFELSQGGTFLAQFQSGLQRATVLAEYFLGDAPWLVLEVYPEEHLFELRDVLRTLDTLELGVRGAHGSRASAGASGRKPRSTRRLHRRPTADGTRYFLEMPLTKPDVLSVLWLAMASDFGPIEPRVNARVRIVDPERKVCLYPYDDRGMDVVGDRAVLAAAYRAYNAWLLDFDRARMDAMFGEG